MASSSGERGFTKYCSSEVHASFGVPVTYNDRTFVCVVLPPQTNLPRFLLGVLGLCLFFFFLPFVQSAVLVSHVVSYVRSNTGTW